MDKNTGRESDKFMLRLPEGMRDALKSVAGDNGRSMNAEIVARLQDSLFGSSKSTIDDVAQFAWRAIDHMKRPPPREMIQDLQVHYLSMKQREADDRKLFIQLAKEIIDTDKPDFDPNKENILRIMADRLGYDLKRKEPNS